MQQPPWHLKESVTANHGTTARGGTLREADSVECFSSCLGICLGCCCCFYLLKRLLACLPVLRRYIWWCVQWWLPLLLLGVLVGEWLPHRSNGRRGIEPAQPEGVGDVEQQRVEGVAQTLTNLTPLPSRYLIE